MSSPTEHEQDPAPTGGGRGAPNRLEPKPVRPGVVSVILVNYKGADDTIVALRTFSEVDWPAERLELIVVDNDSGDGSEERIREALPHVTVVQSGSNTGFAGGCNIGVAHATGEYVAFLNNDARPGRAWISAAVAELEMDPTVGAVASKVLDWDGALVDYVDGSLTWYGMGYKREAERPDSAAYDQPKDVLFGTGAAMFVRASLYRDLGGFDERFFMFYEDVDLGWRLNLLGHRMRYVPGSVAYHKHHVTMKKFGNYRETYLLERNALLMMYKNYDDESLRRALPAALALSIRRGIARAEADNRLPPTDAYSLPAPEGMVEVSKQSLTGIFAVDYFVDQLPSVMADRAWLQEARTRSDQELFPLFRHAIEPAYPVPRYLDAHRDLIEFFGITEHFVSRSRVLVVTGEPLASTMAGPAIRAWEISKALSREHDVRLLSTAGARVEDADFEVVYASGHDLVQHTEWADVIIFQGFLLEGAPWLTNSTKILVADVYDPMHLEQLEQAKDLGETARRNQISAVTQVLNRQLARADFLLCASEKQRRFWLGQLRTQGRTTAALRERDPELRGLIDIVPFGIQDEPPVQRRHGIRGKVPGISADDKIILWGGGVYNWFDPLTLIRAVDRLAARHPDVRLYFMGMKHPNPGVPDMKIAWESKQLADRLGLTGRHVFFNTSWVPYDERADVLLDADVGVSTHFHHVETEFSFRTRILDYLWAGLPIVATVGDDFGNLIEPEGLGRSVPPEDVDALERALEEMLYDEAAAARARERVRAFADRFRWEVVLEPLVAFCREPRRAYDRTLLVQGGGVVARPLAPPPASLRRDLALARDYLRAGGPRELTSRVSGRLRRVWGQRGAGS